MLERDFQKLVISNIRKRIPGAKVFKLDPSTCQGLPDLMIIHRDKYGMLEVKRNKNAKHRPNQDYYVKEINEWSFAAFIHPDNMEEVLNDLQKSLES